MSPGSKAAVTIVSVLGGFILVCGGGGGALYYAVAQRRLFTGGPLSGKFKATVMHDEKAVKTGYYVDQAMQCRIRLPLDHLQIRTGTFEITEAKQGFFSTNTARNLGVIEYDRGSRDFATYVRLNRLGISHQNGAKGMTIESEARTTIGGKDAYELTLRIEKGSAVNKQKQVYVSGPGTKVYVLLATCPEAAWASNVEVFDSSFSTFEIGVFPPSLNPPGAPNGGDPFGRDVPRAERPLGLTFPSANNATMPGL